MHVASAPRMRCKWLMVGAVLIFLGSLLAHLIQTNGDIRIQDVRFTGTNGTAMSGLLYIPATATAKTPAPGILAVHGYFNSREAQSGFAIEFARRGYVVLAMDQTGHGHSAPPAFVNAFGGPDGLKYLRSLDIVDKDNVGLEGHSMGGWTVVNAAAAMPDGYRALVLEGSSTGAPFAPEGTSTFPRNLAVVFNQFDEFPEIMWHVPSAADVVRSNKLQQVFGVTTTIEPGKVYGSIEQGTARVLYTPNGTHPMNHLSTAGIGHSLDWFQRTLSGGTPRPADDQIWYWKETGTFIALIGCVLLILGTFEVLLQTSPFAPLRGSTDVGAESRNTRWWIALVAGALIPAVTYLPLARLGGELLPATPWFPQLFSNELAFWALSNAAIVLVLTYVSDRTTKLRLFDHVLRSAVLAGATFGVAYIATAMVDFFFKVDFRIWFMALKVMSPSQVAAFVAYVVPFFIFFVIVLHALHTRLTVRSTTIAGQYLINVVALASGFAVFLLVQYGLLFSAHKLLAFHMYDPLRVIISINLVPLMSVVAVISTFAYRRTGRVLPGALLCALLVTWYLVVGQATQAG